MANKVFYLLGSIVVLAIITTMIWPRREFTATGWIDRPTETPAVIAAAGNAFAEPFRTLFNITEGK